MPVLVLMLALVPSFLRAEEVKAVRKTTLKETMILLGLYTYGINRETSEKVIDHHAIEYLSESVLRAGESMREIRGDERFKANLENMIERAKDLNQASQTNHARTRVQAKALLDSCAACHRMGSDPYTISETQ